MIVIYPLTQQIISRIAMMTKLTSTLSKLSIAVAIALFSTGCGPSGNSTKTQDGQGNSVATQSPNTAPVASDAIAKTSIGQKTNYTLTAADSDGDQLTFKKLTNPEHGEITYFDKKSGTFTYQPNNGFTGNDKFTYSVDDGVSKCPAKTVTIEVDQNNGIVKPVAPTDLLVTSCTCTAAKLNWNDNSGNENGFEVYVSELNTAGDVVKTWLEFVKDADETYAVVWGLKPSTKYKFEVKAKNEAGSSDAATQVFTTMAQTIKPVAPSNLTASTGENCIRLNWKDNANNETGYEVYKDGKLVKTIDSNCACTIIGSLDKDTTYDFEVRAINNAGASSKISTSAKTKAGTDIKDPEPKPVTNKAPIVNTDGNKVITEGDSVLLKATASDSDGSIEKYEWKEGDILLGTSTTLNYTPTTIGDHRLIVTVTDDDGATASSAVKVVVNKKEDPKPTPNKAPTVNAGNDVTTEVGKSTTITAQASDEDGTIVRYAWKEGNTVVGTTRTINYTPATQGEHKLILTVTDNDGATASDFVLVTATPKPVVDNTKPVITRTGAATITITEGDAYNDAGATANDDKDGDITADIATTGAVNANTPGTYTIRYNVSDAAGNHATEVTRTVIVKAKPVVDNYADWVNAKDSLVHDLSTEFNGNTVKILVAPNNQIGGDDTSNGTDAVYGKINGVDLVPDFLINQNYQDQTKLVVRVYDNNGNTLGTSQEITYIKGTDIDFGNIIF